MLDRQKIRDEISDAARERWNQLNEVGMQGIVAAECADIAMRILDAHGAFEQPQGEQDAKPGPYRLRDLTDDEVRELRARYETSEAAQAEQPQDDGDVRAVAEAVSILEGMLDDDAWAYDAGRARNVLLDCFARELDALEARDAKPAARERVAELAEHAEEER